ncbi:MAG: helix-turn-helix transcriptional regulator [Pseudomonadota bacterium]|nr:helix-turn-helix transcriptional regulator [Pseudomonadota bacterium]
MNITTELMLGFGRTLKAVREREGLTQKKLAEAMGISDGYLKRLEREDLKHIGPNGVSISLLARLAEYLSTHPATLFAEVISHTKIAPRDDRVKTLDKALTSISSEALDALLALKTKKKKPPFGNSLTWTFDMAAYMASLPDKERARIGLEILRSAVANGIMKKKEADTQMQKLFTFSSL